MTATTFEAPERGLSPTRRLRWLVAAEFVKARSTAAWWGLLIPATLISLSISLVGAGQGQPAEILLISLGAFVTIFAVLFGVVCVTAEFRHHTIASSYLVANRTRLILAKLVIAAVVGAGYAVICAAAGIGGLVVRGAMTSADILPTLQVAGGSMLVLALSAVAGVGFGSLVKSQPVAILLSLLYLLIGEPIIAWALQMADLKHAARLLPTHAATATVENLGGTLGSGGRFAIADPWWLTLLVFTGYAALIVLAGVGAARRRDIT